MHITRRTALKWALAAGASLLTGMPSTKTRAVVTPYDSKVGVWHWKGDSITETSIGDVAGMINQQIPGVRMVFVKTNDGADWQGEYDTDRELAIDSRESIEQWVDILDSNDLEFHAWCVVKGEDVAAEVDRILSVCYVRGVQSMLLDLEPFNGYWQGDAATARSLISQVRDSIGSDFHLGIFVDPREQFKDGIFVDEWLPYVNSIHPQCFWETFQRPFREVLSEAYQTWGAYGLPVYPVLQGATNSTEMQDAAAYATDTWLASSLTWWRLGVIVPVEMSAIARSVATVERQFG